uniref:Uncharacterized protein n=1 Tax=Alexandrium catenella TaxID=2925 RepID=A0A7S1S467_ALECA
MAQGLRPAPCRAARGRPPSPASPPHDDAPGLPLRSRRLGAHRPLWMAAAAPEGQSPNGSPTARPQRESSKHSIIAGHSGRDVRVDSFGTSIEKGKKAHRCSFPDELNPTRSVEEKIEVTSYKGAIGWNGGVDSQPGCSCDVM